MDLESIKYLDDSQKNRYAKLERLFDSDGWKLVVKLFAELAEMTKERCIDAHTWEANRFAAGQLWGYIHVTKLEEATEAEFQQMANIAKEAANKAADSSDDEQEFE
jgi:N-acyl-L-homoserine lactone synthetase